MTRFFRAVLLTSLFSLSFVARADDSDDPNDPTYLDGYVGVGGGIIQQITSQTSTNTGGELEKGTREFVRVEFSRLRKHISLDARVGFGKDYTDFGGVFRAYKHWRFNPDTSTGISLGLGLGAMYSTGRDAVLTGTNDKQPFIDVIVAPFVRYIWDFGNDVGISADLEYQIVPYTKYTESKDTDGINDIRSVRSRVMLGVSFLFEVP